MTENKRIIYIDVATEDIPICYKLFREYNLVEQITNQLKTGEPK